jgi:hypothetical protein
MMADMDIADFLAARWDEVAATATAALPGPWMRGTERAHLADNVLYGQSRDWPGHIVQVCNFDYGHNKAADATHIALNDPVAVLADIEAKRNILAEHARAPWFPEDTLARWRTGGRVPEERIAAAAASASCARCHKVIPDAREDEDQCEHFDYPCPTVRLLAVPFAAHPDYDQAWRPQP